MYTQPIRRVFHSREAYLTICGAVEVETSFCMRHKKDESEWDEDERRNAREAEQIYHRYMARLAEAFPNVVCCEAFATGGCVHGRRRECGWRLAPWPWIPHRPDSPFCDCHLETRALWCIGHAGVGPNGYCDYTNGLQLYPGAGPQRGDGAGGAAPVCTGT